MRFIGLMGWLGLAALLTAAQANVELYSQPHETGNQYTLEEPHPDLGDANFRHVTQSLIVRDGNWEFCTGIDYRGECHTLKPGRYEPENLGPLLGHIISARPIDDPTASLEPRIQTSSCSEPREEYCHSCRITCEAPSTAVCTPGYSYPAPPGRKWGDCAHEATCDCIGG